MAGKRKPFGRFSSIFSSRESQSLDEDSGSTRKHQSQSVAELERQVEELTIKCSGLEAKLKKEQAKCLDWKKQMIHSILQKYEPSSSSLSVVGGRKGTATNLLPHRRYASEDSLLDPPSPSTLGMGNTYPFYFDMDNSHPLQNEKLVQHLFQYLKKEDLYRARLVCTTWNKLGKFEIAHRVEAHLHLDNIENLRKFQRVVQLRPAGSDNGDDSAFYRNFYFHYNYNVHAHHRPSIDGGLRRNSHTPFLEPCTTEIRHEFKKVLHIIGTYAKKLTLAYTDSQLLESVLSMCPELEALNLSIGVPLLSSYHDLKHLSALPKLKSLCLTVTSTKEHRITEKHADNFLHVLKLLLHLSHGTLSKLTVTKVGSFTDEEIHVGNAIAQIVLKMRPAKMNELHLSSFPIEKKLLTEIFNARFEFRVLGIGFVDWKHAHELLSLLYRTKTTANRLRRLCVHVHGRCDTTGEWLNHGLDELITNGFSYMRQLTTFDVIPTRFLVEGKYRFERLQPRQSHYLVNPIVGVPVLKSIEIEPLQVFKDIKADSSPSSTPEVQHKVNRFRFVQALVLKREPPTPEVLRKCVKLLSNSLTKLEFVVHDPSVLLAVWNGLPFLEELKIHGPSHTSVTGSTTMLSDTVPDWEAAIIGMNVSDCRRLREDPTVAILIGMTEGRTLRHVQNLPSIRQLKRLRSFDSGNEKYLSDLSVLLCFMKMKTLTSLKFRFKGSYSSIRLLRSEFPGIYLDTWK